MRYAGRSAEFYQRLSAMGAAPEVVEVTDDEIVAMKHRTLTEWLTQSPSKAEKDKMAAKIRDLLRRVHQEGGICHRDIHVRNVVLTDADEPLLIDFGLAVESDSELCYDLYGDASGVPIPEAHRKQGGHNGVWWGSTMRHDSLESAFGPWTNLAR